MATNGMKVDVTAPVVQIDELQVSSLTTSGQTQSCPWAKQQLYCEQEDLDVRPGVHCVRQCSLAFLLRLAMQKS
jgi:hypothetical protein